MGASIVMGRKLAGLLVGLLLFVTVTCAGLVIQPFTPFEPVAGPPTFTEAFVGPDWDDQWARQTEYNGLPTEDGNYNWACSPAAVMNAWPNGKASSGPTNQTLNDTSYELCTITLDAAGDMNLSTVVRISWTTTGTTRVGALIAKYADANNYLIFRSGWMTGPEPQTVEFYIEQVVGGVTTEVASGPKDAVSKVDIQLELIITGTTVTARVDAQQVASGVYNAALENNLGVGFGVAGRGASDRQPVLDQWSVSNP